MWFDTISINLDLVTITRAFYLLSAFAILLARACPPLKDRFLDYGARESRCKSRDGSNRFQPPRRRDFQAFISELLNSAARLKVSHSRFSDFYIVSFICSIFWIGQVYYRGLVFDFVLDIAPVAGKEVSRSKVLLCLLLMSLQSARRFTECLGTRSSSSEMWIGHYFIGIAFYIFTNLAIVAELSPLGASPWEFGQQRQRLTTLDLLALSLFVLASVKQHQYHKYLNSLKKYTLPIESAFQVVVAPHYTAECLIYLAMSILTAKSGKIVNLTLLCALTFVVVNLGVTAEGTKRWMQTKFPDQRAQIEARWRMIPGLF